MTRFEEMRKLLDCGKYFKLVCGAGNESVEDVRRLTIIYVLAGCNGLDVSARPEVVEACMNGIDEAYRLSIIIGKEIKNRPFITVSVGMEGDHHVRKAIISSECVDCKKCIPVCPTKAIPSDYQIIQEKCIGCGNCEVACPVVTAISYRHNRRILEDILPKCLSIGAENIELHAAIPSNESILKEWQMVSDLQPDHFISMCLDRLHLSNNQLIKRIRDAGDIAGERMIIQADGVPMSGGSNNFNITLQAIAIADVINKDLMQKDGKYKDLPILLSGGTNGKTKEMADMCDIQFSGISIGTHARKIVKDYIQNIKFDTDIDSLVEAVNVAEDLVSHSLR